jgi:hypothetical protein
MPFPYPTPAEEGGGGRLQSGQRQGGALLPQKGGYALTDAVLSWPSGP